jgi:hypothetical protein
VTGRGVGGTSCLTPLLAEMWSSILRIVLSECPRLVFSSFLALPCSAISFLSSSSHFSSLLLSSLPSLPSVACAGPSFCLILIRAQT